MTNPDKNSVRKGSSGGGRTMATRTLGAGGGVREQRPSWEFSRKRIPAPFRNQKNPRVKESV